MPISKRTKFNSSCNSGYNTFECHLRGKQCSGRKRDGSRCGRNTYRPYEMCWQHLRSQMKLNCSGASARTTLKDANGNRLPFQGLKANVPAAVRRRRERAWDSGEVSRNTKRAAYVTKGPGKAGGGPRRRGEAGRRWNYCNIAFRPGVSGACTTVDVGQQSCRVIVPEYIGEVITNSMRDRRYGSNSSIVPYGIGYGQDHIVDGACKRGVANYANHKSRRNANAHLQSARARGRDAWRILASKNIYHGQEIFVSYGNGYHNRGARACQHSTK